MDCASSLGSPRDTPVHGHSLAWWCPSSGSCLFRRIVISSGMPGSGWGT